MEVIRQQQSPAMAAHNGPWTSTLLSSLGVLGLTVRNWVFIQWGTPTAIRCLPSIPQGMLCSLDQQPLHIFISISVSD